MEWWNNIWRTRASAWISQEVRALNGGLESRALVPEEDYLTITLERMWIVDVRKGWKSYYGVVHSHCGVGSLRDGQHDLTVIVSPKALKGADDRHLDKVAVGEISLARRIPFVGGAVSLEVGLASVKGSDLAAPFIDLLETLTKTAGVTALSPATPLIAPIKKGFEALLGLEDSVLEIGMSRNLDPPQTGYWLLMRATEKDLAASQLAYDPAGKVLRYSNGSTEERFPYIVLKTEAHQEKDDYFKIPALDKAYKDLLDAATAVHLRSQVPSLIKAFERAARFSPDLIPADGERLAKRVAEKFQSDKRGPNDGPSELKDVGLY